MAVLSELEPKSVFKYFEEICAIPHGSGNTKALSDYCVGFAKKHNLKCIQDSFNNIIIKKNASIGYEKSDTIILQGHLDMVCEKQPNCKIDMQNDGLRLQVDGDFVSADETTLGGDDGIAVAFILSILADECLLAPSIEAVFTVDEETGMDGAQAIDVSSLSGKKMINIDSEDEGVFTVSCAGGNVSNCILPITRESVNSECYKITVSGLEGGHSGTEIDKGRANSNILLGRILFAINEKSPIKIVSVNGGEKDNAIPIFSEAIFYTDEIDKDFFNNFARQIKDEYKTADGDISIELTSIKTNARAMDLCSSQKVITMLLCLPNGIYQMSADIKGLVQTSLNLGILKTFDNEVVACFCVRSSVESQKNMLCNKLFALMKMLGGSVKITGDYPGWEYNKNSSLRDLMSETFEKMYGKKPKIEAIHAGVECGLFAGKINGLDCVSIGPDLFDIHTVNEKMSISSVKRVYEFLIEVLKMAK